MAAYVTNERIEALQYVRALAVLLTLLAHLAFVTDVPDLRYIRFVANHAQFWGGVELFFVVSGYVITASLTRALDQSRRGVMKAFYIKRATRLFPAAWLWIAVPLLGVHFFNSSGVFGDPAQVWRNALACVLFVQNINLTVDPATSLAVYWSLSIEEQFYLIYPWLLLMARKKIGWLAFLLLLPQFLMPRIVSQAELVSMMRYDAILWGVWLHQAAKTDAFARIMGVFRGWHILALALALIGICVAPVQFAKIRYAFSATDFFCMVFIAITVAYARESVITRPAGLRSALNWLGDRSYAIYLAHIPVFLAVREADMRWALNLAPDAITDVQILIPFALTLIVADLTYQFVEEPLRDWGRGHAARMDNRVDLAKLSQNPGELS